MQIKIGETIRALRKRDGRTQEALASAIGVTYQAVSRWEVGDGYPDMACIPAIANYFHVTIDELFGYESDRTERLRAILDKADRALREGGDLTETVAMLRDAVEEFPAEGSLLVRLGGAYLFEGYRTHGARQRPPKDGRGAVYDTDYNAQNTYIVQALAAWETALTLPITAEEQESILPLMVRHYAIIGNVARANALARGQTAAGACREVLLREAADGEERLYRQDIALFSLADHLANTLLGAVHTHGEWYRNDRGRERLQDAIRLLEGLLAEDTAVSLERVRCQSRLADLYCTCALWCARDEAHTEEAAIQGGVALYRSFCRHVLLSEAMAADLPAGSPQIFPLFPPAKERLAAFRRSAPSELLAALDDDGFGADT